MEHLIFIFVLLGVLAYVTVKWNQTKKINTVLSDEVALCMEGKNELKRTVNRLTSDNSRLLMKIESKSEEIFKLNEEIIRLNKPVSEENISEKLESEQPVKSKRKRKPKP